MNTAHIKAFGPDLGNQTPSYNDTTLLRLVVCAHESHPNDANHLLYLRDTDGKLMVSVLVESERVASVELHDVLEAKDWLPSFLGWLMPKRVGHNCDLPTEILSTARQLIENLSTSGHQPPISRNWLPGTDDSLAGRVSFELSRRYPESRITMTATYSALNQETVPLT